MKETAVEWLAETLRFASKELYAEMYAHIEQAKEMEKEQLKNVWLDGRNSRSNGQDPMEQIKNL
jgi:hypothetical protein